ncbi:hypothetical protein [Thomasclavelia cocleata]|jgi:hypothetical protein|uniref:hypothetical protein n=1 Tax=Thomasclavelia cocleata TaxID=69824 RepID=UPI00256ECCE6|nr:hypothetical protein [Thomasclavelia cocleata]
MKRYGCFRLGPTNGNIPYCIFEFNDIIENIDLLNTKSIKALAGNLFIDGRSKKKASVLKEDIIKELKSEKVGSENLEDCLGSTPELRKVTTINDFINTYYKK